MLLKDRLDIPLPQSSTVDPNEIERFAALAGEWWDPNGKLRPIHKFNAVRRDYIVNNIVRHFGRHPIAEDALNGLRILDVGCGAGLLCEPLAEKGAEVVGIDATTQNIAIARWHAADRSIPVDYRHCLAGQLVAAGERFDVVLNTEVIEHVADPEELMKECCNLVAPGGMLIVATLNRTLRAFFLAVVAAEYVLGWLPKGTHDWRRFQRPKEIDAMIMKHGLAATDVKGISFNPIVSRWRLSGNNSVNYMMLAVKAV